MRSRVRAKLVLRLLPQDPQAILEDDGGISRDGVGKIKSEAGYSFPPSATVLGPFASLCMKSDADEILDIGPGMGPDTLVALALGKKVTTIDIHRKQIGAFKQEVARVCGKLNLTPQISYRKGNLADPELKIPEDWHSRFSLVNANKVLHFLDPQETSTMIKNMALATKPGGYATLTFLTPTPGEPEWEAFQKRTCEEIQNPGLIF